MTTKVTKESLAENIGRLESYGDLSINEEYQLKAYRLLAVYMRDCKHIFNWHPGKQKAICEYCMAVKDD